MSPPGPCAQTFVDENCIKILKVDQIDECPVYQCIPGAILAKVGSGFIVKTGDSYLNLLEWKAILSSVGMGFSNGLIIAEAGVNHTEALILKI